MSEIIGAATWLFTQLSGITGVDDRVYNEVAPAGTQYPYIVYSYQSGTDLQTANVTRIWSDTTWLVRVIEQSTSPISLQSITDEIDSRLDRATGGGIQYCIRVQPFFMQELIDGVSYTHLGGFYNIKI